MTAKTFREAMGREPLKFFGCYVTPWGPYAIPGEMSREDLLLVIELQQEELAEERKAHIESLKCLSSG